MARELLPYPVRQEEVTLNSLWPVLLYLKLAKISESSRNRRVFLKESSTQYDGWFNYPIILSPFEPNG